MINWELMRRFASSLYFYALIILMLCLNCFNVYDLFGITVFYVKYDFIVFKSLTQPDGRSILPTRATQNGFFINLSIPFPQKVYNGGNEQILYSFI